MRIAIDVNGVLRDTILKIQQVYEKNYIEKSPIDNQLKTFTLDESGNTEVNQLQDEFEYEMILPVTSTELYQHFKFPTKEDFFHFLYEEYTMEIFGHAPSTETFTFNILNDVYTDLRTENDLLVVSNEMGKSKPATLFFLSKFGCLLEKVKFFSDYTINSLWDEIDILLTSNPNLLLSHPDDKIVIKYKTTYNENVSVDYEIENLKDLKNKLIEIEKNYVERIGGKLLH